TASTASSATSTPSATARRSARGARGTSLAGTDYADIPPPATEVLVPVFRRLYEACMERGLPIGCAPNVHVSLVLLPDEARWLSTRRFPATRVKLGLMAQAAKWQVSRNVRAAERRSARAGAGQAGPPRPRLGSS